MTSGARELARTIRIMNACEREKDQGEPWRDSAEITGNILYILHSHRKTQRRKSV